MNSSIYEESVAKVARHNSHTVDARVSPREDRKLQRVAALGSKFASLSSSVRQKQLLKVQ